MEKTTLHWLSGRDVASSCLASPKAPIGIFSTTSAMVSWSGVSFMLICAFIFVRIPVRCQVPRFRERRPEVLRSGRRVGQESVTSPVLQEAGTNLLDSRLRAGAYCRRFLG